MIIIGLLSVNASLLQLWTNIARHNVTSPRLNTPSSITVFSLNVPFYTPLKKHWSKKSHKGWALQIQLSWVDYNPTENVKSSLGGNYNNKLINYNNINNNDSSYPSSVMPSKNSFLLNSHCVAALNFHATTRMLMLAGSSIKSSQNCWIPSTPILFSSWGSVIEMENNEPHYDRLTHWNKHLFLCK